MKNALLDQTSADSASKSLPESGRTGPSKPLHAELMSVVSDELHLIKISALHDQTRTTADSPERIDLVAVQSYRLL